MPKNLSGGNKTKKQANKYSVEKKNRPTPTPVEKDNSHVAKIVSVMGDCRFKCKIIDLNGINQTEIIVHLPNSSKKYGRYVNDSYVLISLRDFEINKGDILYLYNESDISFLINNNYIVQVVLPNQDDNLTFAETSANNEELMFDVSGI
jgi:translation initiation factor IF-1